MKDEIKEILDKLNKIVPYASVPKELAYMTTNITPQECKTLLDYITNLQEENERLKEEKEDYKSRNKKAIEYIKNNCYYLVDNDDKNLLNILGGDEE